MPLIGNTPTESYELASYVNAYGTIIMVSDSASSPEVYHVIAGVGDIDGPTQTMNVNDKTSHSTNSPFRGKGQGLIDAGNLTFPVWYDPANPSHSASSPFGLEFLWKNRLYRNWRIAVKDANGNYRQRQFRGFISSFGESYPVEGGQARDTTIEIDGALNDV
jgi:hypothetical protein